MRVFQTTHCSLLLHLNVQLDFITPFIYLFILQSGSKDDHKTTFEELISGLMKSSNLVYLDL